MMGGEKPLSEKNLSCQSLLKNQTEYWQDYLSLSWDVLRTEYKAEVMLGIGAKEKMAYNRCETGDSCALTGKCFLELSLQPLLLHFKK